MGIEAKLLKKVKGRTISEMWLGENFTYDHPEMCESDSNQNIPITIVLNNGDMLFIYGQIHWQKKITK